MTESGGEYERALQRLRRALTFGINPSLEGIAQLTEALGRPQDSFRSIQITGTNGKTSTARVAAAALRANGFTAGLYTSPHLVSYTERIEIDGVPVSEEEFGHALNAVCDVADGIGRPFTEFELLTATAFVLFERRRIEWACLEVGMGGRWDATSIVEPAGAVITGVALDHTERLGTTREEIARDKAHIIKHGSIAILGPGCAGVEDCFLDRAAEVGAMVIRVAERDADVTYRVLGRPRQPGGTMTVQMHAVRLMAPFTLHAPSYQAPNVVCGISSVGAATWAVCDIPALQSELRSLTFPGRFELLRSEPPLVIDGAHNPQAAEVLATAIAEAFPKRKPLLVLAVLEDKDALGIVRALAPVADGFVVTQNDSPRCMPAERLAEVVEHASGETPKVEPALERAISADVTGDRPVVVTGSLYTAGGVRRLLKG
jgi:dihydrofolate synthase/folylpolyglutamate synthase